MNWRTGIQKMKIPAVLLLILAAVVLYCLNYYLQFNPFKTEYRMQAASDLCVDASGDLWLVDGKKRISRINRDFQIDRIISGGEGSSAFFVCDNLTVDNSGNLYATNVFIAGPNERYYKQQLVRMNEFGKVQEIIYQTDYDKDNRQRRITGVRVDAGKIIFYDVDDYTARKISRDNISKTCTTLAEYALLNSHWSDVSDNPRTGATEIAYLTGEIISYSGARATNLVPPGRSIVPTELHCDVNGRSYFFDADSQAVLTISGGKLDVFIVAAQLRKAFGEDFITVSRIEMSGDRVWLIAENQVAEFDRTGKFTRLGMLRTAPVIVASSFAAWTALLLLCIGLLVLFGYIYAHFLRRVAERAIFPALLGALPILVAAVFIISSIYADNTANEQREIKFRIENMAACLNNLISAPELNRAAAKLNYNDPDFRKLNEMLTAVVKTSTNEDYTFYGGIYALENGVLKNICSSTEGNIIGYRVPRNNEYRYLYDAFESNHKITVTITDSEGDWLCAAVPVAGKDGKIVGVLEVACDLSMINYVNHANLLLSLVKLISLLYVTLLLTYELAGFAKTKKDLNRAGWKMFSDIASIRQLSFISYFAMRFVSGFMALLVSRYALAESGMSFEFAVGLAYSLDYTAALLVNAKAGLIASKYGWKPQFIIGMIVFAVSTAISLYAPSLLLFMAGQAIGGLAFSLVHSGLTTYINSEADENKRAHNRPGYSSGEYSGTICGLLIGLWLYDRAGVELSCLISIGAALAAAAAIMFFADNRYDKSSEEFAGNNIMQAMKIALSDRETLLFFAFVLVPVTLLIAEPLFIIQLFVSQGGHNIMNIGWGQLVAEFAIVYLSSSLMNCFLQRFSLRTAVVAGCALLVAGHFTAATGFSLLYMYLGMFVVGFGYALTHTAFAEYYLSLAPAAAIGRQTMAACADTVMSLSFMFSYSLIGQMCGMLGLRKGWLLSSGAAAIFLLVFLVLARKKQRQVSCKEDIDNIQADVAD